MRVEELTDYIVRHYFSEARKFRQYGLLFLGAPGIGKSESVERAGRVIASKLEREFIKVVVRWSPKHREFIINTTGEHRIDDVLSDPDRFFVFTDFRLSTTEPTDITGIPSRRRGITFFDPLLWSTLHSASPGILFLDELTWVH